MASVHTHMLHDKFGRAICVCWGEIATHRNGDIKGKDLFVWMNDNGDELTECLIDGTPNRRGDYVVPLDIPVPIVVAAIHETECPACDDVSDNESFYGECCACGKLDPRGGK